MEGNKDQEAEVEHLHKNVTDQFSTLLSSPNEDTLSIAWLRNLLDVFLCCESQFKDLLLTASRDHTVSLDRLIPELIDRMVKSLDICNAVSDGVETLKNLQRLARIAVSALEQRPLGDGQVRRAKKALNSLVTSMMIEDNERISSFKRKGNFPSLSSNVVAPRGGESSGLALPVCMMSAVLVFVMWALVAAIPCQQRNGLGTLPRQWGWVQPMIGFQEKISKKKGSVGLLGEIHGLRKLGQSLIEFADSFQFPAEAGRLEEVKAQVEDLAQICRKMEEGLEPLQQQIREVFHRVLRSRSEFLHVLDQTAKLSMPAG
ncbi:protein ROH1A-like [Gastrolobium bilobum]|uniref:protein ROH1A-like n=1 Tax=Gastrolobium bilobum TaxID=150636 RepID=UPI002AB04999|nr:protein ROH1A-like [Gastrolobium bilobum]